MPLTEEQQFKVAFLSALADEGIGPEGAHQLVRQLLSVADREKQAELGESIVGGVADTAKALGPWALGLNFAIPGALGALGGFGLAKMQYADDEDPAEMRTHESIQNYQRLAAEMAVRKRLRDNRFQHTQAGRPLVR